MTGAEEILVPGAAAFSAEVAAIRAEIAAIGAELTALEAGRPRVTAITIRWEGDPAALDAALEYVRVELSCATVHTDDERIQRRRVLTVLDVLCGVELVGCKLPDGLGVARATSGGDVLPADRSER